MKTVCIAATVVSLSFLFSGCSPKPETEADRILEAAADPMAGGSSEPAGGYKDMIDDDAH